MQGVVALARSEFEVLPGGYRLGTSKQYSRRDFLPLDDPRAMSEGDFIGRLRAVFGPVEGDEVVLRHRATGFVVTAYAAQSGPSYGGGPRYPAELPKPVTTPSFAEIFAEQQARAARVKADPVLAKGPPVDWAKNDPNTLSPSDWKALRQEEREWFKRLNDVRAPVGFDKVVAQLDELVNSVTPVDWQGTRYWGDGKFVYAVGVRSGRDFQEELSLAEGIGYLLGQAECRPPSFQDGEGSASGDDERVVSYWLHHAQKRNRLDGALLPRVQAAWFRSIASAQRKPEKLRKLLLDQARKQVEPLAIDLVEAEAALQSNP